MDAKLLAKAKTKAHGIICLSNTKQLGTAWQRYAGDNDDKTVNNFGVAETRASRDATNPTDIYQNWCNNVMTWQAYGRDDSDNTNTFLVAQGALAKYASGGYQIYKCPADLTVSPAQRARSYPYRVRSLSLNGYTGPFNTDPNDISLQGINQAYPAYKQHLRIGNIGNPADTYTFLDEHPDSINDGYFQIDADPTAQWGDLPASYHNGAAGFTFADGHSEIHKWQGASTKQKVRHSTWTGGPADRNDYEWIAKRASEKR